MYSDIFQRRRLWTDTELLSQEFLKNRLLLSFKKKFWKISTPCEKVFCHLRKYDERWYWKLDLYWHALLDIFTIDIYSSLIINLLCIIKTTNVLPLGYMWSYLILAILFRHVWFYCFQRFSIIWLSNLLTLSVPNEGYSKSVGRTQF